MKDSLILSSINRSLILKSALKLKDFSNPKDNLKFLRKQQDKVRLLYNTEINNSKSIVDSTWGMIKDFFKMSQTTKYTSMVEEIKKEKEPFEEMLFKTQELLGLITEELEVNSEMCEKET